MRLPGESFRKPTAQAKRIVLTVLVIVFLAPLYTFADGTLDFLIPVLNSGTLSYGGGSDPLVGQNIQISSVVGYGGTQNNLDLVGITNGQLSFTSGNSTGVWTWGSGGSLAVTVTGTVGTFTGTLLQGTFGDVYLQSEGLLQFELTLGDFSGTMSSALSNFYGFSSTSIDGSLGMLTYITASPGQSFENAPVLGGAVETVDAVEGGGFFTSLGIFAVTGLALGLGVLSGEIKLAR